MQIYSLGYTLQRKFWDTLPEEFTWHLGRMRLLSAETTPLNELVRQAVQLEEAVHQENITKRMKTAKPISHHTEPSANSANRLSNSPKFHPKARTDSEPGCTKVTSLNSTMQVNTKAVLSPKLNGNMARKEGLKGPSTRCFQCGGPHYATECLVNDRVPHLSVAVRMIAEVEGEDCPSLDEEEGALLEGSQFEGPEEVETLDEIYLDYSKDDTP